jgi:hypothetical protein
MTNTSNPNHPNRLGRLLAPAVLGLLVLGGAACDPGDGTSAHPATEDVDGAWKCDSGAGSARAVGTVTNHSSGTSTYFFTVSFGGGDEASATAEDVEAGETRLVEAVTHHADGPVEDCDVIDVERFSA